MSKVSVVLGMNFGDEGKGHIANFLSTENSLVIRFNGGAQAGHRVVMNDGREHVFHHFGAGTMKGARTFLARHFIVNPLLFVKELDEINKVAPVTKPMLIDSRCRVTTPYDMLINQYSANRKKLTNTVGVGINETVERSGFRDLRITPLDIQNKSEDELMKILTTIEEEYVPYRLGKLGIDKDSFRAYMTEQGFTSPLNFVEISKWMMSQSAVFSEEEVLGAFLLKDPSRNLVFEGAQGLLLDQERKDFDGEVLTRSSTGMKNVLQTLKTGLPPAIEIDLEVVLVSRAYLTRHGDGPLWDALSKLPYGIINEFIIDPSNARNPYQGKMRYAYLHPEWIGKANDEVAASMAGYKGSYRIINAVTCLDHVTDAVDSNPSRVAVKIGTGAESVEVGSLFPKVEIYSSKAAENGVVRVSDTWKPVKRKFDFEKV